MAEAIFQTLAERDGLAHLFDVSSAGTKEWDIGLRPDHRTQKILQDHGYQLDPKKRAQKLTATDIDQADYIIVMTQAIADELGKKDNIHLLMDFADHSGNKDIPDPYPTDTFHEAFNLIEQGVKAFYQQLKHQQS